MVSLGLLLILSGMPRTHTKAEASIYIPNLRRFDGVAQFLHQAGPYAALLRTENWREHMHPILQLDLTVPEEVEGAGLARDGSATLNLFPGTRMSCVQLAEPNVYMQQMDSQLRILGEPVTRMEGGLKLQGAQLGGNRFAGYVISKNEACAVTSETGQGEKWLREAAKLLLRTPQGPRVTSQGALYAQTPYGLLTLQGAASTLQVSFRTQAPSLRHAKKMNSSPYGTLKSEGLGVFRTHLTALGLQDVVARLRDSLPEICPTCPAAEVGLFLSRLVPHLSGHMALYADKVKAGSSLRTPADRYFALKHVLFFETKNPRAIDDALRGLAKMENATQDNSGMVSLFSAAGNWLIGRQDNHVFVANNEASLKLGLAALPPKSTPVFHATEFEGNPKFLAKGLRQVNLLDVLGTPELASLFAAGVEVGPLLAQSEKMTGWAENTPSGQQDFFLQWTLDAQAFPRR